MPLLSRELSLWEISHRWAGLDPLRPRLILPLEVRDYVRVLMEAILHGEIESFTLQLRKWRSEDGPESQRYFIRYYMDDVYACIWGKKFNRVLLKQTSIDRYEMKQWCEGHTIPLPEFWFPAGWGEDYDWKGRDQELEEAVSEAGDDSTVRPSTLAKVACQQIAKALWREAPETTIADMVKHSTIQRYGGAAVYSSDTVRDWLSAVAPSAVKNKRGRPRKKIGSDESEGEAETASQG